MSIARIEPAVRLAGFQAEWIERTEQIAPEDPDSPSRQPAEHLSGPGAVLIDRITRLRPALIVFDLGSEQIPWREWVALIKSVPATRRYPLICFGSHVDAQTLKEARERGANAVFARSHFFSHLPELIQKYARLVDPLELERTCSLALSDLAVQGIELFNRGEFFEAHEALEEAWNEDSTPGRELYRAILQVAVAYLQIERGNYPGALKMFLRLRQWIEPLPERCRGVDIASLRRDAEAVRQRLVELGADRIQEFDRGLFRPVLYEAPA
jgi:predicted metal-dependent hydrolase